MFYNSLTRNRRVAPIVFFYNQIKLNSQARIFFTFQEFL
jgi:hypothetical protein